MASCLWVSPIPASKLGHSSKCWLDNIVPFSSRKQITKTGNSSLDKYSKVGCIMTKYAEMLQLDKRKFTHNSSLRNNPKESLVTLSVTMRTKTFYFNSIYRIIELKDSKRSYLSSSLSPVPPVMETPLAAQVTDLKSFHNFLIGAILLISALVNSVLTHYPLSYHYSPW